MAASYQAGEIYVVLRAVTGGFVRDLGVANNRMAIFQRSAGTFAAAFGVAFVTAAAVAGKAMSRFSADFETSITKVQSLVGINKAQVDSWRESVLKMGGDVAKTPLELGEALFYITSAGIKGNETLGALEQSAKAAAIGLGETTDVAYSVVSAMNAWGKENISASMAASVLFKTVQQGNMVASSLAGSIGQVIPNAAALGVEFHEVGAAMAALTRTGLSTSLAVTGLRRLFMSLSAPSKQAQKGFAALGLSAEQLRDMLGEKDGLYHVLKLLAERTGGSFRLIEEAIPNLRALTPVLALLGENSEDVWRIFKELAATVSGDVNDAFLIAEGTLNRVKEKAVAELQAAFIRLGDELNIKLIPAVQKFTEAIRGLNALLSNEVQWEDMIPSAVLSENMKDFTRSMSDATEGMGLAENSTDGLRDALIFLAGDSSTAIDTFDSLISSIGSFLRVQGDVEESTYRQARAILRSDESFKAAAESVMVYGSTLKIPLHLMPDLSDRSVEGAVAIAKFLNAGAKAPGVFSKYTAGLAALIKGKLDAAKAAKLKALQDQKEADAAARLDVIERDRLETIKRGQDAMAEANFEIEKAIESGMTLEEIERDLADAFELVTSRGGGLVKIQKKIHDKNKSLARSTDGVTAEFKELLAGLVSLGTKADGTVHTFDFLKLKTLALADASETLYDEIGDLDKEIQDFTKSLAELAGQGVSDVLFGALISDKDYLIDSFVAMGEDLASAFADAFGAQFSASLDSESMAETINQALGDAGLDEEAIGAIGSAIGIAGGAYAAYSAYESGQMDAQMGAQMGASLGFMIGSLFSPIGGAIGAGIGLLVGAIVGYLGEVDEVIRTFTGRWTRGAGAEFDSTGIDNELWVQRREAQMNAVIGSAYSSFMDTLARFGDASLFSGNFAADLAGRLNFDMVGDEIEQTFSDFLEISVPARIRNAFGPALTAGLRGLDLGFDADWFGTLWTQALSLAGDAMIDFIDRVVAGAVAIRGAIDSMDYDEMLASINMNGMEQLGAFMIDVISQIDLLQARMGNELDLAAAADDALAIAAIIEQARSAEIEMLRQIQALQDQVNANIESSMENLLLRGAIDPTKFAYYTDQIEDLFEHLGSGLTDPGEIAGTSNDIVGYLNSIIGLIDPENMDMSLARMFGGDYEGYPTESMIRRLMQAAGLGDLSDLDLENTSIRQLFMRIFGALQGQTDDLFDDSRDIVRNWADELQQEAQDTADALAGLRNAILALGGNSGVLSGMGDAEMAYLASLADTFPSNFPDDNPNEDPYDGRVDPKIYISIDGSIDPLIEVIDARIEYDRNVNAGTA